MSRGLQFLSGIDVICQTNGYQQWVFWGVMPTPFWISSQMLGAEELFVSFFPFDQVALNFRFPMLL